MTVPFFGDTGERLAGTIAGQSTVTAPGGLSILGGQIDGQSAIVGFARLNETIAGVIAGQSAIVSTAGLVLMKGTIAGQSTITGKAGIVVVGPYCVDAGEIYIAQQVAGETYVPAQQAGEVGCN